MVWCGVVHVLGEVWRRSFGVAQSRGGGAALSGPVELRLSREDRRADIERDAKDSLGFFGFLHSVRTTWFHARSPPLFEFTGFPYFANREGSQNLELGDVVPSSAAELTEWKQAHPCR